MKEGNGQVQRYEIKNYFGRSYASTCQHCGITIYKRNRNGNGKHAWLAYSKAAYRADAEFEVLCRGCYDKAVKEYGPVISREEMLKKIDMWVNAESGHEKSEKYEKHEKYEKYEEQEKHNNPKDSRKSIDSNNPTPRTKMIEDAEYREAHKRFKPYPIYTLGNVNMLLRAYRKDRNAKKTMNDGKSKITRHSDFDEATVRKFLTFITGFTVGAGMTKRPVMLDAAHKYIGRFYEEYGEEHSKAVSLDLDSISDFFDSMASLGMIRDSVAKKAKNICLSISKAEANPAFY